MQEKEKDIAEIRKLNNQIVNNNMSTVNIYLYIIK